MMGVPKIPVRPCDALRSSAEEESSTEEGAGVRRSSTQ